MTNLLHGAYRLPVFEGPSVSGPGNNGTGVSGAAFSATGLFAALPKLRNARMSSVADPRQSTHIKAEKPPYVSAPERCP